MYLMGGMVVFPKININIAFYFAMGHKIIIYCIVYDNVRQKGGNLTLDGGNLIFTSRLPDGQPDISWSC